MKRIFAWLLALLLLLSCAYAEEISEQGANKPTTDINEISEQGQPVQQKQQYETEGLDWVVNTAPATEPIEEPAVVTEPIEEPAVVVEPIEEPVAVTEPAALPTDSGDRVGLKNVLLAVPSGWTVVSTEDTTQSGGGLSVVMTDLKTSGQLQADSRPVTGIENAVQSVGAESVLSSVLVGAMQQYGIVIDTYDFVTLKGDIPCVKTCQVVNMSSDQATSAGEYAMGIAAMLDGGNMVVIMQVIPGYSAADGAAVLDVVLSPMAAQ